MRALLLAAGLGTRLRPLTDTVPKCLVRIGERPLIDYWLDGLAETDVDQVIVNTHHLAEAVDRHVAARQRPEPGIILVREPALLGTGGTMLANRAHLDGGPFLVIHADNFSTIGLDEIIAAHARRAADCIMTMVLFRTDNPQSCGIVELAGDGRVVAFHEKRADPPGNLANAAIYVFEPEILDILEAEAGPHIDLSTQVIPRLIGRIQGFEAAGYHRDIGTPESLRQANADLAAGVARWTHPRVRHGQES